MRISMILSQNSSQHQLDISIVPIQNSRRKSYSSSRKKSRDQKEDV
ncbi:hypothetical protein HMPREF0762_02082 [Slackia exigua ATCC 700122]|uniref:Uncharacterized protein n=1 Tax=Slackia exigua (strain ATCC 700122 / DSM 15923 / CIP 105133 / JCM 11022 / KCTC 5966 / S-7) TaxID=649764 RepID=D0WJQ5_SLAES|nr:hypothetical protein HMPREF0762_02082 [Slackia exigua ATCC 700122]